MGFWRGLAYALDRNMAQEADKRQREHNATFGGGYDRGAGLLAGYRASRWARQYWQDNAAIAQMMDGSPEHRPGCTCRFCFRSFVNQGFGND